MSEVNDLSAVVDDGILSETYLIERSTGSFQIGGWVQNSVTINGWGVVSVASQEDLDEVPEGDRVTGAMVFHSEQRIYLTQLDQPSDNQRVSDVMVWPLGTTQKWRVLHVGPYPNRMFWKAIAVRLAGV